MDDNIMDKSKAALEQSIEILRYYLNDFTIDFRHSNSDSNFYAKSENVEWTTGFNTGLYWLAYECTQDDAFKEAALIQVDSFLERIEKKVDVDHHDMGFLYSLSCVAAYKLVGSEAGKKAALLAADQLCSRFRAKGQFIQAWGAVDAPDNYRLIIDCLMNLPLLYWASEVSGDNRYRDIAMAHTKTSLENLVRGDYSTYHTYFFEIESGKPLRGSTQQGYRDDSGWARGQAWGIYGLALSYRYTKNEECITLFEHVTDFFLKHCPEDRVVYWDLEFSDGSGEPKDSSAVAIAACGILEMVEYLPKEKAEYYREKALEIANSLMDKYAAKDVTESNGLLLHGVYAKSSPYNPIPEDRGVDECCLWGDYFYMELLMRILNKSKLYW